MMTSDSSKNSMRLATLLADYAEDLPALPVTGLALDSRQVQPGDVFFALYGSRHNALEFMRQALERGAIAIVHQAPVHELLQSLAKQYQVPLIHQPELPQQLGYITSHFWGEPSASMQVIGITGTNGKTSVSHYLAQALLRLRQTAGIIGTLGSGILGNLQPTANTTPNSVKLQAILADLRAQQVNYVAMEVSSHGLVQGRVNGTKFAVAVLTNLTRDHLDYHGDMATYEQAKRRLFVMPGLGAAVVNIDDAFGQRLYDEFHNHYPITIYSLAAKPPDSKVYPAWVWGSKLQYHDTGFSLQLQTASAQVTVDCCLLGQFNAYNVLATAAVLLSLGFALPEIAAVISRLRSVPGRMQLLKQPQRPTVVIDYAHTPQALQAALQAVRQHFAGKIYCVFGCGGNRDVGKRPLMGAIAERYADHIILTDDNPRYEDPTVIVAGIRQGMQQPERSQCWHDRATAIATAIREATADDVILIAGKGHETYQEIGDQLYPCNDEVLVLNALEVLA